MLGQLDGRLLVHHQQCLTLIKNKSHPLLQHSQMQPYLHCMINCHVPAPSPQYATWLLAISRNVGANMLLAWQKENMAAYNHLSLLFNHPVLLYTRFFCVDILLHPTIA